MDKPTFDAPEGRGIYSLILTLDEDKDITVGALGIRRFLAGYYAYTGSARGKGGFKRVMRHLAVAEGNNLTRRWHIDHLLPHTRLVGVVLTCTDQDLECSISASIGFHTRTINRFGCSDCGCSGHLHMEKDINKLLKIVTNAHTIEGTIQKLYSFEQ
ncbi:MAG: GIY-YIG nuclease family protein [ANME-2 cluster archaeon]|nr:GIY-YIG nuclease family protein [ANME-2 cluster archaeon]